MNLEIVSYLEIISLNLFQLTIIVIFVLLFFLTIPAAYHILLYVYLCISLFDKCIKKVASILYHAHSYR